MTHHPHTAYLVHITRENGERIVRCMHPDHVMVADANACAFDRMWEIHSAVMVEGEFVDGLTAETRVKNAIAEAKAAETRDETITRVHARCHTLDTPCPTGLHVPFPPRGETHTPGFYMTTVYPNQETAEFEIEHEGRI